MLVRLNKYIAESGISSRRKVEEFILQGRVEVNHKTVIELGTKVDPENDVITLDGEVLRKKQRVYYVLNKPKGFITSTDDEKKRRTVIELIKTNEKIFPVGRLDYNTTGLLLLTNDGDFSNFLTHPTHKIKRIYRVVLDKPLTTEDKEKLLKGLYLEGKKGKFVEILDTKKASIVNVVTEEGRNHFVKNMFGALKYNVIELTRVSFGGLYLEDLPIGAYRELSKQELKKAFKYEQS